MGGCAAVGCTNSSQKGYLMKHFPKDPARRREWLMKMKRTKWKPTDHSCLCEAHFEPEMWEKIRVDGTRKLKQNAIPTIFTFLQNKKGRKRKKYDDTTDTSSEDSNSSDVTWCSETSISSSSSRGSSASSGSIQEVSEVKPDDTNEKQDRQFPVNSRQEGKVYNPYSQSRVQAPVPVVPAVPEVRLAQLPFYDVIDVVLKPSSLSVSNKGQSLQEKTFYFYMSAQQARAIINSRSTKSSYVYDYVKQVQLRFCLSETICEQEDIFPPDIVVKVNNRHYPMPAAIHTNKPGVEPKRPSQPLDITPYLKLNCNTMNTNTVSVAWTPDFGPGFTISINLVERLTSSDLASRLTTKGPIQSDCTRSLIKEKLNDVDAEIMTTYLRVSLLCPLGRMRMKSPCRASTCMHLQCFDSSLFLQMNERKPTWSCPVCDKPALYNNLIIDGYFTEVLASADLPEGVNEIELHKDGTWSIHDEKKEKQIAKSQNDTIEIIGDDGDVPVEPIKQEVQEKPVEIVDLVISDSEDEEVEKNEADKDTDLDTIILLDSPSPPASPIDNSCKQEFEDSNKQSALISVDYQDQPSSKSIEQRRCSNSSELFNKDASQSPPADSNKDISVQYLSRSPSCSRSRGDLDNVATKQQHSYFTDEQYSFGDEIRQAINLDIQRNDDDKESTGDSLLCKDASDDPPASTSTSSSYYNNLDSTKAFEFPLNFRSRPGTQNGDVQSTSSSSYLLSNYNSERDNSESRNQYVFPQSQLDVAANISSSSRDDDNPKSVIVPQVERNLISSNVVSSTINQSDLSDFFACLPPATSSFPFSK